jgi:hypothetical protein
MRDGQGLWHVWGTVEVYIGFWWGDLRERNHLEDLSVDGRIILKYTFKKREGGRDWIDPFQYTVRWRALVKAVTNVWVP